MIFYYYHKMRQESRFRGTAGSGRTKPLGQGILLGHADQFVEFTDLLQAIGKPTCWASFAERVSKTPAKASVPIWSRIRWTRVWVMI